MKFSLTGNCLQFIIIFLYISRRFAICKSTIPKQDLQNETMGERFNCATMSISRCNSCAIDSDCELNCNITQDVKITDYWSKKQVIKGYSYVNITDFKISDKCQVTLCEDQDLMGYCAQVPFGQDAQTTFGVT